MRQLAGAGGIAVTALSAAGPASARSCLKFDFDWKFHKGDASGAERPDFDDRNWRDLDVPHDWSIEGPFDEKAPAGARGGFLPGGIGWYRKRFERPPGSPSDRLALLFDGVYHNSEVWLNGRSLGKRPYGFVSFSYDLTPHLNAAGANLVAVRVDNSDQPNCRWYSGSGIYRHVWLIRTGPIHIPVWGTWVDTPRVAPEGATVNLRVRIVNRTSAAAVCRVATRVVNAAGAVVGQIASQHDSAPGGTAEAVQECTVTRPDLWSPDSPALYSAQTTVTVNGAVVDEYATPFGIRDIRFDARRGFLLNGSATKMKGVCLHHDAGCLGAAVPERAWERRLDVLKSMGCNAIRTSHGMPAPEFLSLCDRKGFLVIDEAFDKWEGNNARSFADWWERDLQAMLDRDRNHPSVVLWSVGNETGTPGSEKMNETLRKLVEFVHREEPARPVTAALRPPAHPTLEEKVAAVVSSAKLMDVASLNYQEQWYEDYRKADPGIIILGSECFQYFRGDRSTHTAFVPVNPWYDVVKNDYVTGQFLWTGIDYLGESAGWPSKGRPVCPIDTCGFLKANSYFHQTVWKAEPLVRIAVLHDSLDLDPGKPHWGAPKMIAHWNFLKFENDVIRVHTPTNCETVELILNGKSMGVRSARDFPNSTVEWYLPYKPGRIEALGRIGGRIVSRDELRTASAPARILLRADRTRLARDGQDVSHVEVVLADREGVAVPDADRLISFRLEGPGELIGVDNGDLRSGEPYKGRSRTTRFGRCLAIVQSKRKAGTILFTAAGDGVPESRIEIAVG